EEEELRQPQVGVGLNETTVQRLQHPVSRHSRWKAAGFHLLDDDRLAGRIGGIDAIVGTQTLAQLLPFAVSYSLNQANDAPGKQPGNGRDENVEYCAVHTLSVVSGPLSVVSGPLSVAGPWSAIGNRKSSVMLFNN